MVWIIESRKDGAEWHPDAASNVYSTKKDALETIREWKKLEIEEDYRLVKYVRVAQ